MRAPSPSRVLVLASPTADSPELAAAVAARVQLGPSTFTLLVPATGRHLRPVPATGRHLRPVPDPGPGVAEARLEAAIPVLSEAAGEPIIGVVGSPDPLVAVRDALHLLGFDEVIVAVPAHPRSRWFGLDLPRRVRALGVSVTEVVCSEHQLDGTAA